MATVTASVVVQFSDANGGGSGSAYSLTAEIDSRPDGLNKGKTSFRPGDTAYFLVFKGEKVNITGVDSSAGSISSAGTGSYTVTEDLQFANSDEASLSKQYRGGMSVTWLGNNLGSISVVDGVARIGAKGIGIARVSYTTEFRAYGINSPGQVAGLTDFSILAVVTGETVA